MGIAESGEEGDTTIEQDGLKLFLDVMAKGMLMNATIDFKEKEGFVLKGVQQNSCGTCKC